MTSVLLLLGILAGGAIYTIFNPVLLPEAWETAISTTISSIWNLEGILPIEAIFNCLYWDIVILGAILVFKLVFGAIAGKPEID